MVSPEALGHASENNGGGEPEDSVEPGRQSQPEEKRVRLPVSSQNIVQHHETNASKTSLKILFIEHGQFLESPIIKSGKGPYIIENFEWLTKPHYVLEAIGCCLPPNALIGRVWADEFILFSIEL